MNGRGRGKESFVKSANSERRYVTIHASYTSAISEIISSPSSACMSFTSLNTRCRFGSRRLRNTAQTRPASCLVKLCADKRARHTRHCRRSSFQPVAATVKCHDRQLSKSTARGSTRRPNDMCVSHKNVTGCGRVPRAASIVAS